MRELPSGNVDPDAHVYFQVDAAARTIALAAAAVDDDGAEHAGPCGHSVLLEGEGVPPLVVTVSAVTMDQVAHPSRPLPSGALFFTVSGYEPTRFTGRARIEGLYPGAEVGAPPFTLAAVCERVCFHVAD